MSAATFKLLDADEPPSCTVERPAGTSPFLLVCDHAGNRIPRRLGTLGVSEADRQRHIAWDVGAAQVARHMSARLDATLVLQTYSRLVIDCNRDPSVPSAIPTRSEVTDIPGNQDLDPRERQARIAEIFQPYHDCIGRIMDTREAAGQPAVLVAVHSFTPYYEGWGARPWHVGILYNRDNRLPHRMLDLLRNEPGLTVGDNEPYRVSDITDYTIPVHGEKRGALHVEIEVRHDEIESEAGQEKWAARLSHMLTHSVAILTADSTAASQTPHGTR
jgi:predicted N-formylglutamate amidohydrolase